MTNHQICPSVPVVEEPYGRRAVAAKSIFWFWIHCTSDFTGTVGKVNHLRMISIRPDDGNMGPTMGVSSTIGLFKPQSCHLSLDRKNNLVVDIMEIYTLTIINKCVPSSQLSRHSEVLLIPFWTYATCADKFAGWLWLGSFVSHQCAPSNCHHFNTVVSLKAC